MRKPFVETIKLEKIVGGGQTLGALADGCKAFVWGGLPGETVTVEFGKQKRNYVEGIVTEVVKTSPEREAPKDPSSYLSTSPWQIMTFDAEQQYKKHLIAEAFELHGIKLPGEINVYTDGRHYEYRNKVEFSFWWSNDTEQLDLAFFRRGTQGKIPVEGTALAQPQINELALKIRDILRTKDVEARSLKTLMIRSDQNGNCVFQLYVKDKDVLPLLESDFVATGAQGGEVIYSDHRSPASVITKRLATYGDTTLVDTVLGVPFRYACEGFFQGNIPVYEQALRDMAEWVEGNKGQGTSNREAAQAAPAGDSSDVFAENSAFPAGARQDKIGRQLAPSGSEAKMTGVVAGHSPVVDFYSGVGSIGFTIGGDNLTLVEINKAAVDEMKRNRYELGKKATIVEASAESSLEYIVPEATIILDPPRAGLHEAVADRLLEVKPPRIIYLSCNPVTQARDLKYLSAQYTIRYHRGYNFFPRTPHIEHLLVLDRS